MAKKIKPQRKRNEPRSERVLRVTSGLVAEAWSYANPKSTDVVVEVHDKGGDWVGTVTVRVRREPNA